MKLRTLLATLAAPAALAGNVEITVDVANPTVELSPHLYGLFFEDINYAADGGLYAELVQNRSFQYYPVEGNDPLGREMVPLYAWDKVEREGAACELAVKKDAPLNENNTHYLEIVVSEPGAAGVRNRGFDGIRLDAGASYDVSLYAREGEWQGDAGLEVALELPDGTVVGRTSFSGLTKEWKKFESVLQSDTTTDVGRLVVTTGGVGRLHLDMISLFPKDTWKGRKGGLRKDLVQALADLNPKFLRFPGGCIAHGSGLDNVYVWKDTVGDVAERKPNWNLWGYHQTYGLGFYEYFLLCEDLGMHPLPVVPVGVSCGFREPQQATPMDEMRKWVDDALDLIEFANGPADSEWGKVRAEMGHPEPFGMEFICIGNEPHDNALFRDRFPMFVEAIREEHPELKIIGTSGLDVGIPIYDLMTEVEVYSSDEHYYRDPEWYLSATDRFDDFDRDKPLIFIGEYASRDRTLFNALSEAAYLTGVERNADIVDMTCYAPLFGNVDHCQWNPNLIYFDQRTVVRTPSYHVQQLFANHKGDVYLPNTVTRTATDITKVQGSVGVGTWATSAEFDDLKVNGREVEPDGWRVDGGEFRTIGGRYTQVDIQHEGAVSMSRESYEGDRLVYELRARKLGGNEGFLIAFGGRDRNNTYWWNVGGWRNSGHGLERIDGGTPTQLERKAGRIEQDRWYDLKVELTPGRVRCYLDAELIHDVRLDPPSVHVSSTLDKQAGEVILKIVNPTEEALDARIRLEGAEVQGEAMRIILTGDRDAENTVLYPDRVQPETATIAVDESFSQSLPPMSVQFIRVKRK